MITIESLGQGSHGPDRELLHSAACRGYRTAARQRRSTGLSQQKISMGQAAAAVRAPNPAHKRRPAYRLSWLGAIFAVSKNWE